MQLQAVKALVKQGEGQHLEFKKKANHPEKVVKELVAFANTDGGTLLLGVDDNGTVSGVRAIEGELFAIEEAIEKYIRPTLTYSTEIIRINEKKGVASLRISPKQEKVYYIKKNGGNRKGIAFIRKRDQSLKASKEMREILERRIKNKDIQFEYDERVQKAIRLCEEHNFTTIKILRQEAQISKYQASRVLIRLVLANVLDIEATEDEDRFYLKNSHSSKEEWH